MNELHIGAIAMNEREDPRLNMILDKIGKMAALDFTDELPRSDQNDIVDAISMGLNMLSEELHVNVVEKSKLRDVNDKLEKFALTAAHDLKSPINSINGLVSLFEYSLSSGNNQDVEAYLGMLKHTSEEMKNLVQGILNYSRQSHTEIEMEMICMESLIRSIAFIDRVDVLADLIIQNQLPVIQFNKSALTQIFRNLLSNAIKYNDKERCKIWIRCNEKTNFFEICVTDNGPGISQENQPDIFEFFNRGNADYCGESQGIGLASVKSILSTFKERIWVESLPGAGAAFYFTIAKQNRN